jgi:hypothetical protein
MQMPTGVGLKSEGFVSWLSHPDGIFTLEDYCRARKIPYADTGLPVALQTFGGYGLEFQRRFVLIWNQRLVGPVSNNKFQNKIV